MNVENVSVDNLIKRLSVITEESDVMATDLSDIYESSSNLIKLIEVIAKKEISEETLGDTLIQIETELDHINWHYNSFQEEMKKIYEK